MTPTRVVVSRAVRVRVVVRPVRAGDPVSALLISRILGSQEHEEADLLGVVVTGVARRVRAGVVAVALSFQYHPARAADGWLPTCELVPRPVIVSLGMLGVACKCIAVKDASATVRIESTRA